MRKVITIDITNPASADKALKDIQSFNRDLDSKLKELTRRLAWIGAEQASASYKDGVDEGNDNVLVTIEALPNGYAIVASGDDVYFLEFGTGVMAGAGYDTSVIIPPVDISSGSWSRTKGTKEFDRWKSWHHDGVRYTLTIPKKGMYFAVKAIERSIKEVAEEVFA